MTDSEIRMRCLEAAVKFPNADVDGQAAGAVKIAKVYEAFIKQEQSPDEKVLF